MTPFPIQPGGFPSQDWKAQLATGKKTKEDKLAAKLRKDQVKARWR